MGTWIAQALTGVVAYNAEPAILAVYLRQRGSPESKPVGVPHGATGVEG